MYVGEKMYKLFENVILDVPEYVLAMMFYAHQTPSPSLSKYPNEMT